MVDRMNIKENSDNNSANASDETASSHQGINIITVKPTCSVFTVQYCLLTHRDRQFVAFYDDERRITVGSRLLGHSHWAFFQPGGFWIDEKQRYSHVTEYDSHNYLMLAVDKDEYLHISGNMHVDPLIYFRSELPLDIFSLRCVKNMVGDRENRTTYPLFFKDHQGNLLFRYRDGMSGNGDDLYNIYDTQTRVWKRLLDTPLLNGENARNGYARLPTAGPDGFWHMIWMWRDTPHCETNNNLSYARSRDLVHWERFNGQPIELPITLSRGEIVDGAQSNEGLINMSQELGFDNQGRPVITYHRYDEKGFSQAYAARVEQDGQWHSHQLSQWTFRWDFSGGGSIPPDITISAVKTIGANQLAVEYHSKWCPPGVWVLNESTLEVIETQDCQPILPSEYLQPRQNIHPDAEVQLIPAINNDHRHGHDYYLRWESLPIFRDVFYGVSVPPSQLEVISIGNKE